MSKRLRVSMDVISGIYEIVNVVNDKRYVGSSKDIYERWLQHKRSLKKEQHHNTYLQNSWKLHGENSFQFNILEITSNTRSELFEREQYWYDFYFDHGIELYNASSIVECPAMRTTIDDLKNGKRKTSYDQFMKICSLLETTDLPFYQIADLTGVYTNQVYMIYSREYFTELTKDMNFKIRSNNGEYSVSAILTESDVTDIISKMLNGVYTADLSKEYNVSASTINDIRNHRTWKHLTDAIIFPHPKKYGNNNKPILQYDLNMNFIAEYKSAREAEKVTGIGYRMISRVCNYERPHTHGFIFRFKNEAFNNTKLI